MGILSNLFGSEKQTDMFSPVQAKPQKSSLLDGLKNPDTLRYLSAYFKDLDNPGGNAQLEARQMVDAERQKLLADQQKQASRQAINLALQNAYGDDGKFDPMAFAQGMIGSGTLTDAGDILGFAKEATPAPVKPQYIEGPDGIYEIMGGQSRKIQEYQPKPNTTPGQVNPATGRWEWAPGYLEGQGQLAGARRAPPRPRAGPAGPWQRYGGR